MVKKKEKFYEKESFWHTAVDVGFDVLILLWEILTAPILIPLRVLKLILIFGFKEMQMVVKQKLNDYVTKKILAIVGKISRRKMMKPT